MKRLVAAFWGPLVDHVDCGLGGRIARVLTGKRVYLLCGHRRHPHLRH